MGATSSHAEAASRFGKLVAASLCLDFTNTVRARASSDSTRGAPDWLDRVEGERLDSYEALASWAVYAGAIGDAERTPLLAVAEEHPTRAAEVHARAIALREAMYRLFKASVEGWTVLGEDLETLNLELRIARGRERLVAEPELRWAWEEDPEALDRVLWPVVHSAAELLTAPRLDRVRQCPGPDCGWLFLDRSRSGRRRWCDMANCGNMAKVRRFRSRERQRGY